MAAYGDRWLTVGLDITCRQTVSACAGDGCRRIRKRRVPRFGFVTCRVLETTCAGWVCDLPRFGSVAPRVWGLCQEADCRERSAKRATHFWQSEKTGLFLLNALSCFLTRLQK